MADILAQVVTSVPQVGTATPEQATLAKKNEYRFMSNLTTDKAKMILKKRLQEWVPAQFSECGILDLESIEVTFMGTATGQSIYAGFCPAGSALSVQSIGLQRQLAHVFNQVSYGGSETVIIKVPGHLSSRMRGVGVMGVDAEFRLEATKGIIVNVYRNMVLHGKEFSVEDLALN